MSDQSSDHEVGSISDPDVTGQSSDQEGSISDLVVADQSSDHEVGSISADQTPESSNSSDPVAQISDGQTSESEGSAS